MFHEQGVAPPTSPADSLDVDHLGRQFADAVARWHEDADERQTIHRLQQLGRWLKSIRRCRSLSRAELATRTGVAPTQLLLLEEGLLPVSHVASLLRPLSSSLFIAEPILRQRFHDILDAPVTHPIPEELTHEPLDVADEHDDAVGHDGDDGYDGRHDDDDVPLDADAWSQPVIPPQ